MSISANYAQPVIVNGYPCWNCHQVAEAKKDIDPAKAASAAGGPTAASPSVVFGGALAQPDGAARSGSLPPSVPASPALDIYA